MTDTPDLALIDRLIDVIEHEIIPKTAEGVAAGNKVFGAAILRKSIGRWSSRRRITSVKIRSGMARCTR